MSLFFGGGKNTVDAKRTGGSAIEKHRKADRDKYWGPNKLPESMIWSTVKHPERPENVTPEQLGQTLALAQQRKENAERFKKTMECYKQISDADRIEHESLRDFQNHEMKNVQVKVKANEKQAALAQGMSVDLFQRDRAFEAIEAQHTAMVNELNVWTQSIDLN
ncbi:hypothetical protein NDA01_23990 [Trichocoleus desertorum AS-A10]|uniref:hypothetical protein n=1 Tax=Trichocoleus desertorum TaxID=1481672 RepID=UPI00329A0BC9